MNSTADVSGFIRDITVYIIVVVVVVAVAIDGIVSCNNICCYQSWSLTTDLLQTCRTECILSPPPLFPSLPVPHTCAGVHIRSCSVPPSLYHVHWHRGDSGVPVPLDKGKYIYTYFNMTVQSISLTLLWWKCLYICQNVWITVKTFG